MPAARFIRPAEGAEAGASFDAEAVGTAASGIAALLFSVDGKEQKKTETAPDS